ncbi:MAG TPA: ABC transporter ATP-binding protein/permease [Xanthobacteraceae bacterium]|nr:ABC transporter ATP-binding protein/permease [Xanthobacteraceae bacterium]
MQRSKFGILADAWRIARPYWFSEERGVAWGLLAAVVVANLIQVGINVRLNSWRNDFYNALQNYDQTAFFYQLGLFAVLAGAFIAIAVYGIYLQSMLQIRWRRWMTEVYLREWLGDKTYYRLQLTGDATDNPDQRISEDLRDFPAQTLNLSIGLVTNAVQAVSFAFILWDLSGPLAIPLGSLGEISVPGYMLWAALIYTAFFTWITMRLGRRLISLNFQQQRLEADFRFSLVRLREYSESIAFYGGEARELDIFSERFGKVFGNFLAIMMRTMILGFPQNGSSQAAVVFPYLVAAPRFFAERMPLGAIQQVADAFIQFQGSIAYIITAYNDIANWASILQRLETFRDRVEEIHAEQERPQPIAIERSGEGIGVSSLELDLPDGRLLRKDLSFDVRPGEALLIRGPTGSGKSTLLRALAGLWPFGRGSVRLDPKRAFFIPQKSYVPLGTLRHALVYPDPEASFPTERLVEVLKEVGLERFASELDTADMWSQRLSGGEQQRLALARVLLAKPATIFLDEATASLDEAGQEMLYKILRSLPWKPTIISVGHRATLPKFHDRVYELKPLVPA